MMEQINITLGGLEYVVLRARLGLYLDLQEAHDAVVRAVQKDDTGAIADALFVYLQLAIPDLSREVFEAAPHTHTVDSYVRIVGLNLIPHAEKYAILRVIERKKKKVPWEYPGRLKYIWFHTLAAAYGWALNEIADLHPEEAVALFQEIVSEQISEREFIYSLSDVAYSYDKATKRSRFQPLPKPEWMIFDDNADPSEIITTFPKGIIPVGVVTYPAGSEHLHVRTNGKADNPENPARD